MNLLGAVGAISYIPELKLMLKNNVSNHLKYIAVTDSAQVLTIREKQILATAIGTQKENCW